MIKKIVFICIGVFIVSIIGAVITVSATGTKEFMETIEVNQEKTYTIDEVDQINLSLVSADVKFIVVDGNEITVKYYGKSKCIICNTDYELKSSKTNNTITFSTRNRSYFGIQIYNKIKMDVYLPRSYAENLSIHGVSSDISIEDLTLKKLLIENVSGDIKAKNLVLEKADFETVSGEIDLVNLEVETNTVIETISGDIEVEILKSNVTAESISGDMEFNQLTGDFNGNSVSGSIDIEELGNDFEIDIETTSGEVIVDCNNDALFSFNVSTTSGDIDFKFDDNLSNYSQGDRYLSGRIGDGDNSIRIDTVSGDVLIK